MLMKNKAKNHASYKLHLSIKKVLKVRDNDVILYPSELKGSFVYIRSLDQIFCLSINNKIRLC